MFDFENEEALRLRIAKNLIFYREHAGLTQLELAEKLNYSDKSVSKWERGEGMPGLFVLLQISKCFGVTINDLLAEEPEKPRRITHFSNFIITMMSFGLVWLVATFAFIVIKIVEPVAPAWYSFLCAVPINAIVSIVFTCLWWPRVTRFISVSALLWGAIVCLVVGVPVNNMDLFYIFAGICQVLVLLWFMLPMRKKKKKENEETAE